MRCVVYTMFPLPPYSLTCLFGHSIASSYINQKGTLESSDMTTVYNIPSSPISSRSSLRNNGKRAMWMRRRRRNTSVYIDSTGSGGRGIYYILLQRKEVEQRTSVQIKHHFPFTSRLDRCIVQGVEMSEYANELLMELSQFAQEMAVKACEIRILHKILIKNKHLSASVYFCPGIFVVCLDYWSFKIASLPPLSVCN